MAVEADSGHITDLGLEMVRYTTLSGVQQKLSMSISGDHLVVTTDGLVASHVLKPPSTVFDALPENEAVSMRLMALAGVAVPPSGLVEMRDGRIAYLVKRFDRPGTPRKLALEDFCQLASVPPKDKYEGSLEQGARIVRRFASEPGIQMARYFQMVVANWWLGNQDLHNKNLALLRIAEGQIELSPAYDVVNSCLYLPKRELALPVNGKDRNLRLGDWQDFAGYCGLPPRAAERMLRSTAALKDKAVALVSDSLLPADLKHGYIDLLEARSRVLASAGV